MHAQIKNYKINSIKKNIGKSKITMFSDIQYAANFKLTILNDIIKLSKESNPDYICIPGDILDDVDVINEVEERDILIAWLKCLSNIAKVIISIGNHDIMHQVDNKWELNMNDMWFNDVKRLSNVVLLDNSIYEDKKIRFIGFNPSFSHYEKDKEDIISFLIEINIAFNSVLSNDLYNIMLCHTPTNIFKDFIIDNTPILKNIDLVLSGHIHGGLVPPIIERLWDGNKGFIDPQLQLFPEIARGLIRTNGMTGIISTGITKLGPSTGLLAKMNCLYPMNINNIEIGEDFKDLESNNICKKKYLK